jgi:signal transduction histidine kinase
MEQTKDSILYIDDEVENLRGFQFLYKNIYNIYLAQSAEEGFEILKTKQEIKLILADQRMPKMTGVDFFEITSDLYPNIVRIVITGFSDIEAIIKAINKGKIFQYVTKPWDKEELRLIIDKAIWAFNIVEERRMLILRLEQANQNLERKVRERTIEILRQKKEIEEQRDMAKQQRDQIALQNKELERHHTQLEKLVMERTVDLMAAKEKAEESDRLKTAFLANFSHEIRTPMNAIMGFSQLLSQKERSEEERKEFVELIITNSHHLLNMINDIIDISKIEAGETALELSPCNVNLIMEEITSQYKEQKILLYKSNIKLIVHPDIIHTELTVQSDTIKLRQVLINLLENALEFTDSGFIEMGFTTKLMGGKDFLVVYVKDTGIGIEPEDQHFIFDRFRKVENKGADKLYRGAGLGLAISKRLVELLGGKIWVESVPGSGSIFYFTLPYVPPVYISASENPNSTPHTYASLSFNWDNKRILVAEDEPSNYKYLEKIFQNTNIKLLWAKNGLEAYEMVEEHSDINLILMDIRMPVMDGYEAIRKIRNLDHRIPIIAQTAYALENEKEKIMKAGCNDLIAKPFEDYDLFTLIDKYLSADKYLSPDDM